jgi:IS1 family transposase
VAKLLVDVGRACSDYQAKAMRNLKCKRIQCDEIWSFVGSKEKNTSAAMKPKRNGDCWTWTALCPVTKLISCWFVGDRSAASAYHFVQDLAGRLASRFQLTADRHNAYVNAVEGGVGSEIDYAMPVKIYRTTGTDGKDAEVRCSPAQCMGARKTWISGMPEVRHVSTSQTERQNLSMRMGMRRFTRLANAFSKTLENREPAVALYFMYFNFARIHQTLRVPSAMEAGISNHVWTSKAVVDMI